MKTLRKRRKKSDPDQAFRDILAWYEEAVEKNEFTAFERAVMRELLKVPVGTTISYKELARRIGRPRAYRAVARVMKKNPFFLILPCHRVIASDGSAGGYNRGVSVKEKLLLLERKIYGILYSTKRRR